jgi:hypothetical protein
MHDYSFNRLDLHVVNRAKLLAPTEGQKVNMELLLKHTMGVSCRQILKVFRYSIVS